MGGIRMAGAGAVVLTASLLVGCGEDDAGSAPGTAAVDDATDTIDAGADAGTPVEADSDDGSGDVVITVDGRTYPIPNFMGGRCETHPDPDRNSELAVSGFAESGERIELSFSRQSAETSPSGEDEYYGSLGIASGTEGNWNVTAYEPWPWMSGDRSHVASTVSMEDADGGTVEVAFDIACP